LPESIDRAAWARDAERVLRGEVPIFSGAWLEMGFPPRWHRSVLTRIDLEAPTRNWTEFDYSRLAGGDVKGYWEIGRFDGLLLLALGWLCSGADALRSGIEQWISNWCERNPTNCGIHWACGQEAGIRLMQLLLVADVLHQWSDACATPRLHELAAQHCARIAPTMLYAIGQDNNHGTSEAAALFVAGAFLKQSGRTQFAEAAGKWCALGRRSLEERVSRLVMADGSFSQNSVNYHRMLLDTLSFSEFWRSRCEERVFSDGFYSRSIAATRWLAGVTDPISGDAPNLGANDGARLFVLHQQPYRDYRPSVQLASILFCGKRAYSGGPWDEPLRWLELDSDVLPLAKPVESHLFPEGGYAKLQRGGAWLVLRLPQDRFRPSQADALHIDFWHEGENLLRDAGTYSYTDGAWRDYFSGTAAHNTVEFDNRDQMPRLGRFLFGGWLACRELVFDASNNVASAAYRDTLGAYHKRCVELKDGRCIVSDMIGGFSKRAVLRWRLKPGDWQLDGARVKSAAAVLSVTCSGTIRRVELAEGWESRYYGEKTVIPVLEVEVDHECSLQTTIELLKS
jgi:hypothetical protein